MTKQEFLEQLSKALTSRAGSATASENVSYYEEYIATQVRAGRTEEEILAELGDPRLLARSIAEAQMRAESDMAENDSEIYEDEKAREHRKLQISGVVFALIIFLVIFGVLRIGVSLLRVLFPILFPLFLIVFFLQLIQRK